MDTSCLFDKSIAFSESVLCSNKFQ